MVTMGIRYDLRNPSFAGVAYADRVACAIEQAEWAEALGFEAVTLSEHHGADDGYLPSLFAMAGAIASRTSRIRIRLAALIAPFHDPLRVAEDAAFLDHLSRGRLDLVIAGGYVPSEFSMFGVATNQRAKAVVEMVDTLRQAWTGEPFAFRGRPARVTPTPFTSGGPPIWLGAAAEAGARRAARIADGFVPTLPHLWDVYRDELTKLGKPDPGPASPNVSGMYLHVASDTEAAWKVVGPHALYEMNAYGQWAAEAGATSDAGSATGYQPMADVATLRSFGMHVVVTPQQLIDRIGEAGPSCSVMFHPLMGGMPLDASWENLRLFETAVLPQVR